ncbi:MAG: hypothetical protein WC421_07740 [Elusimicrobiales bacterium]
MKIRLSVNVEIRMGQGPETGMSLVGYMPDGTTYKDPARREMFRRCDQIDIVTGAVLGYH